MRCGWIEVRNGVQMHSPPEENNLEAMNDPLVPSWPHYGTSPWAKLSHTVCPMLSTPLTCDAQDCPVDSCCASSRTQRKQAA